VANIRIDGLSLANRIARLGSSGAANDFALVRRAARRRDQPAQTHDVHAERSLLRVRDLSDLNVCRLSVAAHALCRATIFLALFTSLEQPSRQSMIPNLVPREQMAQALALQRHPALCSGDRWTVDCGRGACVVRSGSMLCGRRVLMGRHALSSGALANPDSGRRRGESHLDRKLSTLRGFNLHLLRRCSQSCPRCSGRAYFSSRAYHSKSPAPPHYPQIFIVVNALAYYGHRPI